VKIFPSTFIVNVYAYFLYASTLKRLIVSELRFKQTIKGIIKVRVIQDAIEKKSYVLAI